MKLSIRRAVDDDIQAMYRLTCAVHLGQLYRKLIPPAEYDRFAARYTPSLDGLARYHRRMRPRLADPHWALWVAAIDDVVCGFTLAHDLGNRVELRGLFVAEEYQGRGIGRRLFELSCSTARPEQAIELEVIDTNELAIGLYLRHGFTSLGRTDTTYYGAHKIRMRKPALNH